MDDDGETPRRDRSAFYVLCAVIIGLGMLAVYGVDAFFAFFAELAPRH